MLDGLQKNLVNLEYQNMFSKIKTRAIVCERCGEVFKTIGSRAKFCPSCRKMKWRLWKKTKNWEKSKAGKDYMTTYAREYRDEFKKKVFDYYGWHCNCCNEQLKSMLTIDHVHNDGYKDRKLKISGASLYKKIIKLSFPSDYQVLCMNCNWSKKINKGTCQHKI